MAEMLYNTSKLYHMWAKKENISNKAMARYWHGEHESFIYERRIAITKGWEDGIKKARKMMQSQKFKMFMNKRIIKRFANQIKDSYWADKFVKTAEARMNGDEVNKEDNWGAQRTDYQAERLRFKSKAHRLRRKKENSIKRGV